MSETSEQPWAIEDLTIMDRRRSRVICFFGDSDQDRADAELVIEAVNGFEAAEAELASVREELAAFHAECDKVFIPHDAEGLVRHHRGNAGLAGAFDGFSDGVEHERPRTLAAEARVAQLEAVLRETVDEFARFCEQPNLEKRARAALAQLAAARRLDGFR